MIRTRLGQPEMLYQRAYLWLVLASAMDILITWAILFLGGREVNGVADAVIAFNGKWGVVLFKFAIVTLVIMICEHVGRKQPATGHRLAWAAVAISFVPVVAGASQIINAMLESAFWIQT